MTRVPVPRYDLLDMPQYLFGSVQFSRGCPFQCEFCDIIVTFGRRPRLKTPAQMIAELDRAARATDGDRLHRRRQPDRQPESRRAAARGRRRWQEAHGFPFVFVTEASLDLAEDPGLMRLMLAANILSVFIGIESPNEASLVETKKHQNVKAGRTADRARAHGAARRAGGVGRDDCRLRSRRRVGLRCPGDVPARGRHRAGDDRHALRHPQDAAARQAGRRGPARRGRPAALRHQRRPGADEPPDLARRVRRT